MVAILDEKSNIFWCKSISVHLIYNIGYWKQEKVYLKHSLHAKFKNSCQTVKWGTLS